MQVELLDRQRWRTRVELANAIFEYLEIFQPPTSRLVARDAHTRRSSKQVNHQQPQHENPTDQLHRTQGTPEPSANPGRFTVQVSASHTTETTGRNDAWGQSESG